MRKSRIWRANSKVTPLDSVVSTHPQNISLSLPTDLKKLRSIGPFYLAIIELNPKQPVERMSVNKSDSYFGCRRKNVKRPFGTKNVCEEADRFCRLLSKCDSLFSTVTFVRPFFLYKYDSYFQVKPNHASVQVWPILPMLAQFCKGNPS